MRINLLLLIILCLLQVDQMQAEDVVQSSKKFERFSNKEGFNQNTINAIEQDLYGILWFGTPNGLFRYDGYEFESFSYHMSSDISISNNFITSLHTDSMGILWIGTREGVNVYIPWLEKFLTVSDLKDLKTTYIHSDESGRVWISGGKELYSCEVEVENSDITFNTSPNIYKDANFQEDINKFSFIDDNEMLILSFSGLLGVEFSNDQESGFPSIDRVIAFNVFTDDIIRSVKKVGNIYWVATSVGLYKTTIEGDKIHIIKKYESFSSTSGNLITNIFEDNFGKVWIGTTNEGLARYIPDSDEFEYFKFDTKNEYGISSKRINCIFQDNYNVLWLGTAQGGINKLDLMQKPFLNYAHNPYDKSSISGNLITSIMEDSKGQLWLSSFGEGICRSETTVTKETVDRLKFDDLKNKFPFENQKIILTFYEDRKGFVWIGSTLGLMVYNPAKDSFKQVYFQKNGKALDLRMLRVIEQIDDNHIFFGGFESSIVENPWQNIEKSGSLTLEVDIAIESLSQTLLQCFLVDSKGDFWLGTRSGLYYSRATKGYDNVSKISVSSSDGNSVVDDNIFSLLEDTEGNIWVGTFGKGLKKLHMNDEGKCLLLHQYSKDDLLPDDAIYGMIQEDADHLWISTDMGLCRLNTKVQESEEFDVRDGLANNNFRQAAFFKGNSGYFYFGGLNGLTVFEPADIKKNEILPKVLITSLYVNDKKVEVGDDSDGELRLEKSILVTDKVTFNHDQQIIAFEVVVQHSNSPFKNQLQYKLEGFSEKWMLKEDGKTNITYTNLPSGDYVFKVKGANADGLWNETSTDLLVRILPPWYKKWWAYLIYSIIIIGLIFGGAVYYTQLVNLTQNLKYEKLDKKRIDALNHAKLAFFTNISHEFRTPLTLISGPLDQLLERKTDDFEKKNLSIIHNNTKRLLRLVDQLITFRRAEQGHMQLNYSRCTLEDFISPITDAFEEYGIRKNVNFFYKILSPHEEVIVDVDKMERILFNLLSNSFKYTPAHGNISIETDVEYTKKEKRLVVRVIDNGKGIPLEKQEKIFDRFYQLEGREENIGGTGIGLSFCKTLVDNMQGKISVESTANVRTCFTVSMPCDIEGDVNKDEFVVKSSIKDWIPVAYQEVDESVASVVKSDYNILIVEDEPEVREFIKKSFEDKYNVETVENGVQALDLLKLKTPDLILSDVMMPEMDGFELCKRIKMTEATCHLPVILLTALGDNDNMIKGLEFGADDYISKPFSLKHLQLKVGKLIENNARRKEYFQKSSSLPATDIELSDRDRTFLNKIIDSIEKNLSNSHFGVEELAGDLGISTAHFYRRLKHLTGQIPNVYLRNYRLERAAKIIKENKGDNITEIMFQVGFESNSYFSTAFKKLYGCSPSEYLKKR